MANRIKVKRSAVQGKVPQTTDLELGELAINTYDGKLFAKINNGSESVVQLGGLSLPWANIASKPTTISGYGITDAAPAANPTFTGIVTVPAGTAAAPSLTITGDTNTGIYSPGADQIALATGGTGRVFFDASGNVGIGTGSPSAKLDVSGSYAQVPVAVPALAIDCSTGNYFTKTINGDSTFTVTNVPASRSYAFTLELTHTSGAITWFSGVIWPGGTAPTLTTGKVHLFFFQTSNGGTTWRAASLANYAS